MWISAIRAKFQHLLVMKHGINVIAFLLFAMLLVKNPKLIMRQRRLRIHFQRLFECIDRAPVIARFDTRFRLQKIWVLAFLQLRFGRWQTTAQSHAQEERDRAAHRHSVQRTKSAALAQWPTRLGLVHDLPRTGSYGSNKG